MRYFVDEQSTVLRVRGKSRTLTLENLPTCGDSAECAKLYVIGEKHDGRPDRLWRPDVAGIDIRSVAPVVALAEVVSALEHGRKYVDASRFFVPRSLSPCKTTVQQLQVIDAFLHQLPYPRRELRLEDRDEHARPRGRGGKEPRSWDGGAAMALMFDGVHHLDRRQRDKDAEISATIAASGLPMLRVTAGMLRSGDELLARVVEFLR